MNQTELLHLYGRAGFGRDYPEIRKRIGHSRKKVVDELFDTIPPARDLVYENMERLSAKIRNKKLSKKERRETFAELRRDLPLLNINWLERMASEPNAFRERMTLFWHGHFATRIGNSIYNFMQNSTLRNHALGSFSDLLMAVSKDPAMLIFLNNQQNKKQSPNENFAREVMELFTLGRGHYTEDDIREAARAFTGWGIQQGGGFFFNEYHHDAGTKTIFGQTGDFKGEDVIGMLLENRQTARFICEKVYRYFVNPQTDKEHIKELTSIFYDSSYDISILMRHIFMSDWFYEAGNIGVRIKSPVDLLAGLMGRFRMRFNNSMTLIYLQKTMGQVLFQPPNVAGWPGGRSWIDSSSLMLRMRLPEALFLSAELNAGVSDQGDAADAFSQGKPGMNAMMSSRTAQELKRLDVTYDIGPFESWFDGTKSSKNLAEIAGYLLPCDRSLATDSAISDVPHMLPSGSMDPAVVRLLSSPSFQLC